MVSPLVTIIIPCYNGAAFVGAAIRSALAQTYRNREIIVIDDGSTDSSREVIESFGDVVRVHVGENQGGSGARNRGLALARGEYVQFLDADDVLAAECLAVKVRRAVSMPEWCHCCDWTLVTADGRETTECPSVQGDDSVVALLNGQVLISSPLHRLDNLRRVGGFDEKLPCSQERDLHLRLASAGVGFTRVEGALFRVHRRAGSVSADFAKVLLQHFDIYAGIVEQLAGNGVLTPARRFALARSMALDGRRLYHRSRRSDAERFWRRAHEIDPAGLHAAYTRGYTRRLSSLIGPELTDRSVALARRVGKRLGVHVA